MNNGLSVVAEWSLSPREIDVLRWISLGKRHSEIAVLLGINENTSRVYLSHACVKLGASTGASAVRIALKEGLI